MEIKQVRRMRVPPLSEDPRMDRLAQILGRARPDRQAAFWDMIDEEIDAEDTEETGDRNDTD